MIIYVLDMSLTIYELSFWKHGPYQPVARVPQLKAGARRCGVGEEHGMGRKQLQILCRINLFFP